MATYRIGQKCRMVNCENSPNPLFHGCNGDEVVILALPGGDRASPITYEITRPAHMSVTEGQFFALPEHLTPLTDHKADEFIARLEKLGREPVIQPVEVER